MDTTSVLRPSAPPENATDSQKWLSVFVWLPGLRRGSIPKADGSRERSEPRATRAGEGGFAAEAYYRPQERKKAAEGSSPFRSARKCNGQSEMTVRFCMAHPASGVMASIYSRRSGQARQRAPRRQRGQAASSKVPGKSLTVTGFTLTRGTKSKSIVWHWGIALKTNRKSWPLADTRKSVWPKPARSVLRGKAPLPILRNVQLQLADPGDHRAPVIPTAVAHTKRLCPLIIYYISLWI